MTAYIIRRLIQAVIVLIMISLMVFTVMRLLPGDPLMLYIAENQLESLSDEEVHELYVRFGLDKSLPEQYVVWIGGVVRGDFGESIFFHEDVGDLLKRRLPVTFHLGILAFIVSSILGISLGIVAALRRGSTSDMAVTTFANFGISVPHFWLGILMIYLFALKLGWLPTVGYTNPFEDFWMSAKQMIMPVTVMGVFSVGGTTRQTRSSLLEVIRQDYIRTAWAKGLPERTVVMKHVLKNGLIPVVTLIGMHVRMIFGGSVLVETIFNIPGMGRLIVEATFGQDYQVVQAGVLLIGFIIVMSNLLVDISYGWLDPRVRYG